MSLKMAMLLGNIQDVFLGAYWHFPQFYYRHDMEALYSLVWFLLAKGMNFPHLRLHPKNNLH